MFGLGGDDEHFLAGDPPKGAPAPQFASKSGELKWRNGYLATDLSVEIVATGLKGKTSFPKGTLLRVYEGTIPAAQRPTLLGDKLPNDVKLPGPKGNWIVEIPPTAPNQWMIYPNTDGVALTPANQSDRASRLYIGAQDPLDLVPLSEGDNKALTDDVFNAIGKVSTPPPATTPPATSTSTTPATTPPKQEGSGLATLAIAGGLLLLLGKGK